MGLECLIERLYNPTALCPITEDRKAEDSKAEARKAEDPKTLNDKSLE
jgi:hypothetical protein